MFVGDCHPTFRTVYRQKDCKYTRSHPIDRNACKNLKMHTRADTVKEKLVIVRFRTFCTSVCLSFSLFFSLSACLSVCLSVSLSIYLSVWLSLCLSLSLSICLSALSTPNTKAHNYSFTVCTVQPSHSLSLCHSVRSLNT